MSCINTGATTAVVHRGKLIFTVYLCEGTDVTKKDEVNLMKEVVAMATLVSTGLSLTK
jgi:hypothetical protein